jgi:hypothetical protein
LPYVFGKIFEKGLAWAAIVVLVIKEIHVLTVRAEGTVREARAVGGHSFKRDWGPALIARPSPSAQSSRIAATFRHSVRRLRGREESDSAVLMESRERTKGRRRARGYGAIIGERGMSFGPGMKSALMELSRGVKSTPVHISFSKSEKFELVLENERA